MQIRGNVCATLHMVLVVEHLDVKLASLLGTHYSSCKQLQDIHRKSWVLRLHPGNSCRCSYRRACAQLDICFWEWCRRMVATERSANRAHQPAVPGPPLKGPTMFGVTQPP